MPDRSWHVSCKNNVATTIAQTNEVLARSFAASHACGLMVSPVTFGVSLPTSLEADGHFNIFGASRNVPKLRGYQSLCTELGAQELHCPITFRTVGALSNRYPQEPTYGSSTILGLDGLDAELPSHNYQTPGKQSRKHLLSGKDSYTRSVPTKTFNCPAASVAGLSHVLNYC